MSDMRQCSTCFSLSTPTNFALLAPHEATPVCRCGILRSDLKLNRPYHIIQDVTGWNNCHLHEFLTDDARYCKPDPDDLVLDHRLEMKSVMPISQLAAVEKSAFIYDYNFGDGWEHEIVLEKILPPDENFKHPVCVARRITATALLGHSEIAA